MNHEEIVSKILRVDPNANREVVENYVKALDRTAHPDLYGTRRLPSGRTVEEEALRVYTPPAPKAEPVADKRPGELTDEDYKSLPHEARLLDKMKAPPPERKERDRKPGLPEGMSLDAFLKLSPEDKLRAANEAAARKHGYDKYDGRGGV